MPRIVVHPSESHWFRGLKFAEKLYLKDGLTLEEVETCLNINRRALLRDEEYLRGVDDYLGYAREKLRAVHH
ncbi:hypothetical protein Voja6_00216 [Pseudomonas phage vB_PpuM-Voja-6]